MEDIKLTHFSKGSGCGCKIAPADLDKILANVKDNSAFKQLLVGHESKDDAAIYDNGDDTVSILTTDFFTPIVDDPTEFGKIAAANAINDIYAMGGKPLMAIAILGWPIEKLSHEMAGKVIEGGRVICSQAGIPLAGGHSIDAPEPFFGLAVTGIAPKVHVKSNNSAQKEDILFLTKPLGTGIVSTAQKRGKADPKHVDIVTKQMQSLNIIGQKFGSLPYLHAMTDVTGFGLLGHLIEMCEGSQLSATIEYDKVPILPDAVIGDYLRQFIFPDNTFRNFKAYGHKVSTLQGTQLQVLCDPQTSGGLLVAIDPNKEEAFISFCKDQNLTVQPFGFFTEEKEKRVEVITNVS